MGLEEMSPQNHLDGLVFLIPLPLDPLHAIGLTFRELGVTGTKSATLCHITALVIWSSQARLTRVTRPSLFYPLIVQTLLNGADFL